MSTQIAAPHDLRVVAGSRGDARRGDADAAARDALVGAAEAVLELERLALASPTGTTVGTVGVMRISPRPMNVIPGPVELDLDMRDSRSAARE